MTYRATDESSDLTASEREREAYEIVIGMNLPCRLESMTTKEADFVSRMASDLGLNHAVVSVKQLWWLRDLKEKYLL